MINLDKKPNPPFPMIKRKQGKMTNLAKNTIIVGRSAQASTTGLAMWQNGYLNDTTQYTAFTLTPGSGTLTGGTIRVYGYQNS